MCGGTDGKHSQARRMGLLYVYIDPQNNPWPDRHIYHAVPLVVSGTDSLRLGRAQPGRNWGVPAAEVS